MARRLTLLAGIAVLGLSHAAEAMPLIWTSDVGGAPTGAVRENFDGLSVGGGSAAQPLTPSGIAVQFTGNAGVVQGFVPGQYAPPSLSGDNGAGFGAGGGNQANGANATGYLTSGSAGALAGSAMTLLMPYQVQYFGLLWGSVDGYNTLSFFDGATLIGRITGGEVSPLPNGDQGPGGTRYVNVNSTLGFDRVVASSSNWAFEFDNVAFHVAPGGLTGVPEPATMALFAAGLLGLGLARWRAAARI